MTRFDDLGRQLAREQDALRARSTVRTEVRARLDTLEIPEVKRQVWPLALSVSAAAAALALGLSFWLWPVAQQPTALAVTIGDDARPGTTGTWVEAPSASAVAMVFSDGTRVDVQPNSRARIAELRPNGAHLLLENGLAQVNVKHRDNTAWRVSAGPFAVKVTGTRFDVRWTPEQDAFELDLHEGHVEISGCVFGETYALHAGQRAVASCRQGRLNVGAQSEMRDQSAALGDAAAGDAAELEVGAAEAQPQAAEAEASAMAPVTNDAPVAAEPATNDTEVRPRAQGARKNPAARSRGRDLSTRWRALAEAGRYSDALAIVRSVGFLAACRGSDAADLIMLSDLARYGRDYDAAAQALHLLRQRFGGSRQASQAAFALGKLQFDQDGSYSEAAWWFRTYLREQPTGSLAREASGRLLEATSRSGDAAHARELAADYLRDYPNGPHAALANSLR